MFEDRQEAGNLLALKLRKFIKKDFVVVALLRGGIILGKEISDYFNLPLKPMAVKKIGAPLNPELGIGAVTSDKTYYFDRNLIRDLAVSVDYQKTALENKRQEAKLLQEKVEKYTKKISLRGKHVIIVDDGIAIGATAICASLYLKKQEVKRIILAIPVISKDVLNNIKKYFDKVVSLKIISNLSSVSQSYKEFPQVTDEEVLNYLV